MKSLQLRNLRPTAGSSIYRTPRFAVRSIATGALRVPALALGVWCAIAGCAQQTDLSRFGQQLDKLVEIQSQITGLIEIQSQITGLDVSRRDTNIGGGGDSITTWLLAAAVGCALIASYVAYPIQRRWRLYREKAVLNRMFHEDDIEKAKEIVNGNPSEFNA